MTYFFRTVLVILISVTCYSCNDNLIDINTTDPQVSKSLGAAKNNGLYLSTYSVRLIDLTNLQIDTTDCSTLAWTESVWFNEIRNSQKQISITDRIQLVFDLNDVLNVDFKTSTNQNLKITDQNGKHVCFHGNIVTYDLDKKMNSPSIKLSVFKGNNSKIKVIEFNQVEKI